MFRVGQKVVCVDDSDGYCSGLPVCLQLNGVYVISSFSGTGTIEVDSKKVWYSPKRFRPAVKRKTDISIFTKMLTPSDEKVGSSA